jgi:Spy/CpxP family protein refolding chaperone
MKKILVLLVAIGLGALLLTPAFALGPRDGREFGRGGYGNPDGPGRGYYGHTGLWRLNLTDDQKAKIEALQIAHYKGIRPIREKMFDKSVELRRLWLQANPDKNKINATQKEVRALRDKLEDNSTELSFEINKVLTPEQKEILANSGWGRGPGFGPRGGIRGPGSGFGPGMCY